MAHRGAQDWESQGFMLLNRTHPIPFLLTFFNDFTSNSNSMAHRIIDLLLVTQDEGPDDAVVDDDWPISLDRHHAVDEEGTLEVEKMNWWKCAFSTDLKTKYRTFIQLS